MTNNNDRPIDRDALRASLERRLASLRSTPEPIMPPTVRRLPPRPRRNSVRHRAIR